jgi:3-oxoadipate enol-lactonase
MIAFSDVGTGPAILFLHGFPHNRSIWAPQLQALAGQARCIAPDLRGFGETPAAPPPYSIDQYADDIAQLLDALRLGPVAVAGLSMGGVIAFALWRRHRHLVRALLLVSTRAERDTPEGAARRRALAAGARIAGVAAVSEEMAAFQLGRHTRARNPALVDGVRRMMAATPLDGFLGAIDAMLGRDDSTPTLATIDVPAMIVAGGDDELLPASEATRLHAAIAGSRLEVLADAGHLCNMERPAAFTHVTSDFLSTLPDLAT